MMYCGEDTICAPATPPGTGGIGVLRVSGPTAFQVADKVLVHARLTSDYRGHTLHRATLIDVADRHVIDDVLVAVFHAPASYTGEDVVEISCHGGALPIGLSTQALIASGARLAEPGEFTFRAYMNGKMDLAQAEAVCDLITAQTAEAHRAAVSQHGGQLSSAINAIRDILLGLLARIEASIDFPEDIGELSIGLCRTDLADATERICSLLNTANRGILYRQGARVVLTGLPNVGKSSLMNALLRTSRAIVTPMPGTTRDVIEETMNVHGIPVRLIDTAGWLETTDLIERLGVERTQSSVESADLVLVILDASVPQTPEVKQILQRTARQPHLVVANKIDLAQTQSNTPVGALAVSALTGQGIDEIEMAIATRLCDGTASPGTEAVVTHARHRNALLRARERIDDAFATIDAEMPADFIAIDVRGAITQIEEVTGRSTSDDIITEIFSRFCIGK